LFWCCWLAQQCSQPIKAYNLKSVRCACSVRLAQRMALQRRCCLQGGKGSRTRRPPADNRVRARSRHSGGRATPACAWQKPRWPMRRCTSRPRRSTGARSSAVAPPNRRSATCLVLPRNTIVSMSWITLLCKKAPRLSSVLSHVLDTTCQAVHVSPICMSCISYIHECRADSRLLGSKILWQRGMWHVTCFARQPAAPRKKGRKWDVRKSTVPDPAQWDKKGTVPQTSWRRDLMKSMTYTQFWQLVKERQIDKVRQRPPAGRHKYLRTYHLLADWP